MSTGKYISHPHTGSKVMMKVKMKLLKMFQCHQKYQTLVKTHWTKKVNPCMHTCTCMYAHSCSYMLNMYTPMGNPWGNTYDVIMHARAHVWHIPAHPPIPCLIPSLYLIAGLSESANSSILASCDHFKEVMGKKITIL